MSQLRSRCGRLQTGSWTFSGTIDHGLSDEADIEVPDQRRGRDGHQQLLQRRQHWLQNCADWAFGTELPDWDLCQLHVRYGVTSSGGYRSGAAAKVEGSIPRSSLCFTKSHAWSCYHLLHLCRSPVLPAGLTRLFDGLPPCL